jgi:hypothetical protein
MATDTLIAKPTTIDGITFRSRLEARFYEWLKANDLKPEYEPRHFPSKQGYTPDFYIPEMSLYVETKPRSKLSELGIFKDDIQGPNGFGSKKAWIAVDQRDRDQWDIIDYNDSFAPNVCFYLPSQFEIVRLVEGGALYLRIFPVHSYVIFDPRPAKAPDTCQEPEIRFNEDDELLCPECGCNYNHIQEASGELHNVDEDNNFVRINVDGECGHSWRIAFQPCNGRIGVEHRIVRAVIPGIDPLKATSVSGFPPRDAL